ncbi:MULTISPECIES: helix-turn-helix transcriptional regulator [Alphaproteobacteria]|uniref:DNA-binding protein n=2 Tax=Alphaproteobacteria TaxID=28211 RepID=A0A512HJ44_9HYPH|nr:MULTISPECIES: YafY family protein [Alphaproteobacteria]GEO85430.1 DNA-binding protein [Ciceribacter naphthalenivorans]GLR21548.1 DNA-binding protein [Ciceribacter naphthalenivorans]GLT04404.1 DNA-binding protein [Sphingomonas psychrolutea]
MSRSARLLFLLQILRRHRRPVSGAVLASELGVSLRTLYRDIAILQAQGANIEGEAGVGYVLRPGYMLPPLMFSREEIEALVLGARLVTQRADRGLALSARDALAKITEVLPGELRDELVTSTLLAGPAPHRPEDRVDLARMRQFIRSEQTLKIAYRDEKGDATERVIWPFALTFFEGARVVIAWCTLRNDFRSFRTDRMDLMEEPLGRYPKRRMQLLKTWRQQKGIPERML